MPLDRHIGVLGQPRCSVAKVHTLTFTLPIAFETPSTRFARVAKACPAKQLAIELSIHPVQHLLGDTGAIVLRPPSNFGIESFDQAGLRRALVLADDLAHFLQVSPTSFLARLDERLKTWPSPVSAGMVCSHPILSNIETEEIKTHVSLVLVECVGYAGLAGL